MEAYELEINKPEHYWSFLNTDAVELIGVISAISSECSDEYFRNAPIACIGRLYNNEFFVQCAFIVADSASVTGTSEGVACFYESGAT